MTRGAYYRHGERWTLLYRLREATNLSQPQAAAALRISERTYRTREKDADFVPTAEVVAAFGAIAEPYYADRLAREAERLRVLPDSGRSSGNRQ
jgi:transcriptional regulator with XRE-family HTH domain